MKTALILIFTAGFALAGYSKTETIEIELTAARDTFGRSNMRNRNNGASPELLIANNSSVKTIIGFELLPVTNEIVSAEFSVCMQNTADSPISLVIAPMVQTPNNASWNEGAGALGVRGQNARVGEATFSWRYFREHPWEMAAGIPVQTLMDSRLWKSPVLRRSRLSWQEGKWINVPIHDAQMLEDIRKSESPVITFGIWGTSGNGLYNLCSKETKYPPKLRLVVKENEDGNVRGN